MRQHTANSTGSSPACIPEARTCAWVGLLALALLFAWRPAAAQAGCDTTYPRDFFHVCYFDGTEPRRGVYLGAEEKALAAASSPERVFAIDENWANGAVFAGRYDRLSSIWRGEFFFSGGRYQFGLFELNDGARLYVDEQLVFERWRQQDELYQTDESYSTNLELSEGYHTIRLEWFEQEDRAALGLYWDRGPALPGEPVRSEMRVDVFLVARQEVCIVGAASRPGDEAVQLRRANGSTVASWRIDGARGLPKGIRPSDPSLGDFELEVCLTLGLSDRDIEHATSELRAFASNVENWSFGALKPMLEFHRVEWEAGLSNLWDGFWLAPRDMREQSQGLLSRDTDFVIAMPPYRDLASGALLDMAPAGGLSYGHHVQSLWGTGYSWINPRYVTESVITREWGHQLTEAMRGIMGATLYPNPTIYPNSSPTPGFPPCGMGDPNPFRWFVITYQWANDPDFAWCGGSEDPGARISEAHRLMAHFDASMQHYPTGRFTGNHCDDGVQNFGETAVDLGGDCLPPGPPDNDDLRSASAITEAAGSIGGVSNLRATSEPGEPRHAGVGEGASVWWTWTARADGWATFDTLGSDFDTVLAVYVGEEPDSLTEITAVDDWQGTEGTESRLRFRTAPGMEYRIAVDGYEGQRGEITLNWDFLAGLPGEVGTIPEVNERWLRYDFKHRYVDPVTILGPPSDRGGQPGVLRIRSVAPDVISIRFREWTYLDGTHVLEQAPYLTIDRGRYELADGNIVEAGIFRHQGTGQWVRQTFEDAFPGVPRVFVTVQSHHGGEPLTVRVRAVDENGFSAAFFEEEALMNGHRPEDVGYLAVYSPVRSGQVTLGGQNVPYAAHQLMLDERFQPILSHTLRLEEERSQDSETYHVEETVAVLVVGKTLLAQIQSVNGGDTVALRARRSAQTKGLEWGMLRDVGPAWSTVPLQGTYVKPVVIAKPVSAANAAPGVARIGSRASDHFSVRFQAWNYVGATDLEGVDLFYLVAEAGPGSFGSLAFEAGLLQSDAVAASGRWEQVRFGSPFDSTPALFTSIQSASGTDTVTTRVKELDSLQFKLAMDEQETKAPWHVAETLGWVAIQQNKEHSRRGRRLMTLGASSNDSVEVIHFEGDSSYRHPVMVADVTSTRGSDPVVVRYEDISETTARLFLAEEQSADPETKHVLEDISILLAW